MHHRGYYKTDLASDFNLIIILKFVPTKRSNAKLKLSLNDEQAKLKVDVVVALPRQLAVLVCSLKIQTE